MVHASGGGGGVGGVGGVGGGGGGGVGSGVGKHAFAQHFEPPTDAHSLSVPLGHLVPHCALAAFHEAPQKHVFGMGHPAATPSGRTTHRKIMELTGCGFALPPLLLMI